MFSAHTAATQAVADDLISLSEAARVAGVTRRTFERWIRAGRITPASRDHHGWRLFHLRDAQALRPARDTFVADGGPDLLSGELSISADLMSVETGVLRPLWLVPGPQGLLVPDRRTGGLVGTFLRTVAAAAPFHHRIGTFGARIIDAPAEEPGTWHSDPGGGIRYVAVVHSRPDLVPLAGQEFRGWIAPSGRIAAYTTAEHRSPVVPEGRRIFLSAATYEGHDPADCDLSYAVLAGLRTRRALP